MTGKNFLRIPDCVSFSFTNPSLIQVKDDYEGAFVPDKPGMTHPSGLGQTYGQQQPQNHITNDGGLLIRIAATHSGIVTRNNGFYLPEKMKKGSSSFTDNYAKPILLHHEDHKDPIGRVKQSGYVDTSGVIQDQYNGLIVKNRFGKEIGVITDTLIKDFSQGKMPFSMQVDIVTNLFKDSLLEDGGYQGLGYIQLVANITSKDAIQKLLDGRYLTGSVGATTDKAICSICKQDWTDTGQCDHSPGGIYDGSKCFIIAGDLAYDEYSFVNTPADRHSKVLELNYNGRQDNIEIANEYSGRIYETRLEFPQYDSVKEEAVTVKASNSMSIADATSTVVPEEQNVESEGQNTESKIDDSVSETVEDANKEENKVEDFDIEDFLDKVMNSESLSDEDEEKLYDLLWNEIKEDGFEDAKLSSEQRKKLSPSKFCGPNKSFPVPDCAHVTAARRLIGRYKGEGNKKSILACVDRKAKVMGCDSESKDTVEIKIDSTNHTKILKAILGILSEDNWSQEPILDEENKNDLNLIIQKITLLVTKDNFVTALAKNEISTNDSEKMLLDEIAENEELIGQLKDQLKVTQKEYTDLAKDLEVLQDGLIAEKKKVRETKESYLTTIVTLKEGKVENRDWSKLDDSTLELELGRTSQDIDMIKITDKLGDGMSRVPTESVDSPVEIQDKQQKGPSLEELQQIESKYFKLLFTDKNAAENFLRRMQAEGKLPSDNKK